MGTADHREDDVATTEFGRCIDDSGAELDQWFGLRLGSVVEREVDSSLEEAGSYGISHPADADPSDFVGVVHF